MLNTRFRLFPLLLLLALLGGCSSGNSDGPRPGPVHPQNWAALHGAEAKTDLASCTLCHGLDFQGGRIGISCYDCHLAGPPFALHPLAWTNVVTDHQGFADSYSWTGCAAAACHGATLQGGAGGPSCLRATLGSVACHPGVDPPAPGNHVAPFTDPANHGPLAKSKQLYCRNCHGRPDNIFDGGFVADALILNNPSGNCSGCHSAAQAHPTNWQGGNDAGAGNDAQDNNYASSHRGLNTPGCQLCHSTTAPGIGPIAAAPSCFDANHTNANGLTTGCHGSGGPGATHSLSPSWLLPSGTVASSHVQASIAGTPDCSACHAQSGGLIQPDCGSCHTATAPNNVSGSCDSCHNTPPDGLAPAGNARPNRAGGHLAHDALTTATGNCSACHNGAGSDTLSHYDATAPANVAFVATYSAKAGAAAFTPDGANPATGSCTNVSCHGGQTSPDWLTGSLIVDQDCTSCHEQGTAAQAPENNSYYSGRHITHAGTGGRADTAGYSPTCSACHDATALAVDHFANLDTAAFEGTPAATLVAGLGYDTTVTPPTCTTNIAGCHSGSTRSWSATGGAPHALDGSYLLGSNHGPDAKGLNSSIFPNGMLDCQPCHGEAGGAGSNPQFNIGIFSQGGNGCEGCHNTGTAHPSVSSIMSPPNESVDWYDGSYTHRNVPNALYSTACALCHGANLEGLPAGTGPSCSAGVCHVADPVVNSSGCVSCHATPPSSAGVAGNVRPNRAGAHTSHNALTGVTGSCAVCHNGVGYGTLAHFDMMEPADVAIPAVAGGYMAQTGGSPVFTPNGTDPSTGTCSNVSCHGGKTTLDWATGSLATLTGNALCLSCHASGTSQYNSYDSGRHNRNTSHTNFALCTECHDPTKLTNSAGIHFNDLATTAMTEAKLTIKLPGTGTYTPGAISRTGTCNNFTCHGFTHSNESW
ncbi:CxxxxCH/CxxCH domain-containing protein [Desulfuromonas carbonis]|uniref:CxxxxCH/CxxCH domain c-type cytochrome n=1 Tax=Desulfuromonas sp. DDH964 TaxID=1823759 RepID=UPI00078BA7B2|nr:CxxxxCH/CxxCH domain-containing protein [Desulfuromonas sp. DDH964]AMV73101.1 putative multiheme cytochrome c, extracellular electron transfer conduit cluster [Desulfuromonas sp. DDH964]